MPRKIQNGNLTAPPSISLLQVRPNMKSLKEQVTMTTNSEATSKISDNHCRSVEIDGIGDRETLYTLLRRFVSGVTSPDPAASPPPSLFRRIRTSFLETAPKLPDASRNSAHDLLIWTRRGSPLRSLLVISVGTIVLVALTGLLVFTLFLLAATLNAVIISFLVSLAAAGGFLALFFACLTAVYIWSLSVAIFAISITTSLTIFAVVIATVLGKDHLDDKITAVGLVRIKEMPGILPVSRFRRLGWVGFFWVVWLAANKSLNLAKSSLSMTTSALAAYSTSRHSHHSTSLKSAN